MSRKLIVKSAVVLALYAMLWDGNHDIPAIVIDENKTDIAPDMPLGDSQSEDLGRRIPDDVETLDFISPFPRTRVIRQIEITVSQAGSEYVKRRSSPRSHIKATSIVSTSPAYTRIAENSFHYKCCLAPLRIPNSFGGWGGGGALVGTVKLTTEKEEIVLGMTMLGFTIDGNIAETHTRFFSPAGAILVKKLIIEESNFALPDELVEALSGESFIDSSINAIHSEFYSFTPTDRQLNENE